MNIISILVGQPEIVDFCGRKITTSIFKKAITGSVKVNFQNIEGDKQADLRVHGGNDKAIYAYSLDAYTSWNQFYGKFFQAGSFGENLIINSFNEKEMGIGDIYQVGTALLQIVQPRVPCYKLGVRLNDVRAIKSFNKIQRSGIYFRVIQEGVIESGQELIIIEREKEFVSVQDLFKMTIGSVENELLEKILKIKSLNIDWRLKLEEVLK